MIWHVIPIDDTMEHIESEECACGPLVEVQEDNDVFVIHSRFDGQEEGTNELVPQYEDKIVETTNLK
jgi:hypothetical protein